MFYIRDFQFVGLTQKRNLICKVERKKKEGRKSSWPQFFRFLVKTSHLPSFFSPYLFLSLSLRFCFSLFHFILQLLSKKVAQTSRQRLNQSCRKLSDASCQKEKNKNKIQSAEQNFSQGRWRPCGIAMLMSRQLSVNQPCGWLWFQLYFGHGSNKSSSFSDRFRNEKWYQRAHSACTHLQHFQSLHLRHGVIELMPFLRR